MTTFINLPVRDITHTTEFFTALGFSFDPHVGDANTACMIIDDGATVMLHSESFFREFTQSELTDTTTTREVVIGLSAASRQDVDDLTGKAVAAGGQAVGEQDQGFMYMRAFRDLDGHQWSVIHMDMPNS